MKTVEELMEIAINAALSARNAEICEGMSPISVIMHKEECAQKLAELHAALAESIPQWRPIDESIQRNKEYLVWRSDSGPFIAKLTIPEEVISEDEIEREGLEFPSNFEEWWSDAYGWQEGSDRPTHYQPLPPPPKEV